MIHLIVTMGIIILWYYLLKALLRNRRNSRVVISGRDISLRPTGDPVLSPETLRLNMIAPYHFDPVEGLVTRAWRNRSAVNRGVKSSR